MAGKIFYGTSETAAGTATKAVNIINWATEKEVTIRQESKDDENVTIIDQAEGELTIGDILVVLFTNGNTSPSVTLSLGNGTISNEVDVTNDTGIPVRSYAVDGASLAGAWTTGEAKIFVLAEGNNDKNYFEMLGSIKGDGSNFGNVQITDQVGNEEKWASDNLTLSPSGVKSYVDNMANLSLGWSGEQGGSTLGTLSLNRGTTPLGTVTINYPTVNVPTINSTNQILNDGPKGDPSNKDNNKYGVGNPFLTKNVPNRICFYKSAAGNPDYNTNVGIYYGDRGTSQIENQHLIMNVCSNDQYNVDIYNPHTNRPVSAVNFHGYITLNPAPNSWVRIGEAPGYGGNLWVKGDTILNGDLTVNKNLTIKGSLNYTGNQTFNNSTTFNKPATFNNGMSILGKNSQNCGLYVRDSIKTEGDLIIDASSLSKLEITDGYDTFTTIDKDGIVISSAILNVSLNISKGLQLCNSSILKHVCTTVITLGENNTVYTITDPRLKSSDPYHPVLGVIATLQDPPDKEIGLAHVRNDFANGKMTLKFTKTMPKNKPFRINYLIISQ